MSNYVLLCISSVLVIFLISIQSSLCSTLQNDEELIRYLEEHYPGYMSLDEQNLGLWPKDKRSGQRHAFSSWAGKRSGNVVGFSSWAGKRKRAEGRVNGNYQGFSSWAGKRAPFSSWAGKRSSDDMIYD